MGKIQLHGDFILTSDLMIRLNDIIYAKDPVKEAIEFKRDIIVEDIDYWENIEGDFDKMTQYWEGFSSYHEKTDILYTNIVKKDLISNDGEFYFSDSTPYQGDYHQHSDGQAMTGSEHTEESEPIYRKSSKDKIFKPRKGISQRKINSYKNNYNIPSVRGFTKPDYNEAKKLKKVPISKDGFVKAEPIMTTLKAPKIKVKKIETKKY